MEVGATRVKTGVGNPVWCAHVLEERKQGGDLDFVWTFSYSVNTVLLVNVYLSGMLLDIGDPVVTKMIAPVVGQGFGVTAQLLGVAFRIPVAGVDFLFRI